MKNIVLATSNAGKLREIRQSLSNLKADIILQSDLNINPVAETGLSFVENAILKARHAAEQSDSAAIADDSGLVVDALQGEPGIYSARYAGEQANDSDNIHKLLRNLETETHRQAKFYCVMVYITHALDPIPIICQGTWAGEILKKPQGEKGFGYDPIFYVSTHGCSAAELDVETKNKISHRGEALRQLKQVIM